MLAASFFTSFISMKSGSTTHKTKSKVFKIEHKYQIPRNNHMISVTSATTQYKRSNYFTVRKKNLSTFTPTRIMGNKDNISIGRKIPQVNLFPGKNGSERLSVHSQNLTEEARCTHSEVTYFCCQCCRSFPARADIVVLATPKTYLQ